MEETVGRFYCLHSECKNVDEKSFESRPSFVEHWNDKHATVKNNENTFQVNKKCGGRNPFKSYFVDGKENQIEVVIE